jgi:hypothetical protein
LLPSAYSPDGLIRVREQGRSWTIVRLILDSGLGIPVFLRSSLHYPVVRWDSLETHSWYRRAGRGEFALELGVREPVVADSDTDVIILTAAARSRTETESGAQERRNHMCNQDEPLEIHRIEQLPDDGKVIVDFKCGKVQSRRLPSRAG